MPQDPEKTINTVVFGLESFYRSHMGTITGFIPKNEQGYYFLEKLKDRDKNVTGIHQYYHETVRICLFAFQYYLLNKTLYHILIILFAQD